MSKHTSKLAVLAFAAWTSMAWAGNPTQHIDGKNYKIDVSSTTCKVGGECAAVIKIATAEGYHLNKEYPYKITMPEKSEPLKYAKPVFGRESGDFVEASETAGTITIKFKPAKAGTHEVLGKLALAVCSKSECATAKEDIKLPVVVKN